MILAAGQGTRLRPLTSELPKPLVPVANRAVLHHVLDNVRRHGIKEVVINLHWKAEEVKRACGNGDAWGLKIHYSHETELLGTAGAVKKVEHLFKDGPFIILSGDGISDVDPWKMLAFHRKHKALGTIGIKSVEYRFDYGVTMMKPDGRITKFIEKPSWGDVFSDEVNTGIYLFDPAIFRWLPKGKPYDFGRELWPRLLKEKQRIYGMKLAGYWCDVGNLSEYRRVQRDLLDGKVKLNIPGTEIQKGVWVAEGAHVDPGAELKAPCVIGHRVKVAKGAVVGPYTVVGDDSVLGVQSVLENCIIWSRVSVGNNVRLSGCIIGEDGRISDDITAYEGAVLNVRR